MKLRIISAFPFPAQIEGLAGGFSPPWKGRGEEKGGGVLQEKASDSGLGRESQSQEGMVFP